MPDFFYKILDKNNKVVSGTIKASSKRAAKRKLTKDGSIVILVVLDSRTAFSLRKIFPFSRFSAQDRINFFRNLAAMIAAGITVSDALRVLGEQVSGKQIKKHISQMVIDIENGQKLSAAMAKVPRKYFSEFLVEAVNLGEVAGKLTDTLDRISDDLQYQYDLQRKVKSSMAYPTIVIFVMLIVAVVMMVYVLPQIATLFKELGTPIPLPTKILLWISAFIQNYYYVIIGALIIFIGLFIFLLKKEKTRYYIHYLYLKAPIFGKLIKETNLAIFFRSLEALFNAVPFCAQ